MGKAYRYLFLALIVMNAFVVALFLLRPVTAAGRADAPATLGGKRLERGVKHTLYVGLNDKDAGEQLIPLEEAKARLNAVAAKHVSGFTVRHAEGYWTNAAGVAESEQTLVYDFLDAPAEQVGRIVDDMKAVMNQEAILVEKTGVARVFY